MYLSAILLLGKCNLKICTVLPQKLSHIIGPYYLFTPLPTRVLYMKHDFVTLLGHVNALM